jgi:hypothetical protein
MWGLYGEEGEFWRRDFRFEIGDFRGGGGRPKRTQMNTDTGVRLMRFSRML